MTDTIEARPALRGPSLFLRVMHWINAAAVFAMILSGWRIFNASPLFEFRFPGALTLGGWLAGALAWHFAAMWALAINAIVYLLYGLVSGHFWRDFLRVRSAPAVSNARFDWRRLAAHRPGEYNLVQRILYVGVMLLLGLLIATGLAIWKPVQFQQLTGFFGGYDLARYVHFYAMTALCGFVVLHVWLAFRVKGVLRAMITGRLAEAAPSRDEIR